MLAIVDSAINNITTLLQKKKMYQDTLVVFSSDNGGKDNHYLRGGHSNWPLRGHKGTDLQGGVRVPAFVSGGVIPTELKATQQDGYIHICDWYATFAEAAMVPIADERGARMNLPEVDAISMWDTITNPKTLGRVEEDHPRHEIPISSGKFLGSGKSSALIRGPWKLLRGFVYDPDSIQNHSSFSVLDCSLGCLFHLKQDPGETADVALQYPEEAESMRQRAQELDDTYFQACSGSTSTDIGMMSEHLDAVAYGTAVARGFFWGPWAASSSSDERVASAGGKAWPAMFCSAFHGDRYGCLAQLGRCGYKKGLCLTTAQASTCSLYSRFPSKCKTNRIWCDWNPASIETQRCTPKLLTPGSIAQDQTVGVNCGQWDGSKEACRIREFWCDWNGTSSVYLPSMVMHTYMVKVLCMVGELTCVSANLGAQAQGKHATTR